MIAPDLAVEVSFVMTGLTTADSLSAVAAKPIFAHVASTFAVPAMSPVFDMSVVARPL